jgi:hypothetical protein
MHDDELIPFQGGIATYEIAITKILRPYELQLVLRSKINFVAILYCCLKVKEKKRLVQGRHAVLSMGK